MDDCCISGFIHSGQPAGNEELIQNSSCYTIGPESNQVILFLTDAFGWKLPNSRLFADSLAKSLKVKVIMPDFLGTTAIPFSAEESWTGSLKTGLKIIAKLPNLFLFLKTNSIENKGPGIAKFCQGLADQGKKVGVVGFCWGGGQATALASTGIPLATVICHPAMVKVPEHIDALKNSCFFVFAESDNFFGDKLRKQTEQILINQGNSFKLYPKTIHGFAIRGSQSEKAREEAFTDICKFFKDQLITF